jgi:N-acetyl-gamma-glutamyl-phosphate reductase
MHSVFIDGQEGTTGLEIHQRLKLRRDIELLEIAPERRKDAAARKALVADADILITCLPDAAAREAVLLAEGSRVRIIDPSTAHRTAPGWVYGLPELGPEVRQSIREARRVTNPGCHATGFIAALYPLVKSGWVPADYPVVAHSITGYSGGGKSMIADYEGSPPERRAALRAPRPYALTLHHKHVPEMQQVVGLREPPLFHPIVDDFYQGMLVCIPIVTRLLPRPTQPADLRDILARHYEGEAFVRVMPDEAATAPLSPLECNHTNRIDLFVFGHSDQALLVARLDNLGKGACGAAVQSLNLMIGADERTGLA